MWAHGPGFGKAIDMIEEFYFSDAMLNPLAERYSAEFKGARPFDHVVMDGLVPDAVLQRVVDEFPTPDRIYRDWSRNGEPLVDDVWKKQATFDESQFGPFTRHFLGQLNSATFMRFLERVTGEPNLVVDHTYSGGGLHSTAPGGALRVHSDTSRHPNPRLHQRFNLIWFLNPAWQEAWGGHLELWNDTATQCVRKVLPVFNRAVLFNTDATSFHGHPTPLACPPDVRRNSIAIYYYSVDRPISANYEGAQRVEWRSTTAFDFKQNFKDVHEWAKPRVLLRKVVPPILWDAVRLARAMRESREERS
jgi:hypothetical protein